jgi:hypothetical protein
MKENWTVLFPQTFQHADPDSTRFCVELRDVLNALAVKMMASRTVKNCICVDPIYNHYNNNIITI